MCFCSILGTIKDKHTQSHREGRGHLISQDESIHNVDDFFMGTWQVRSHLTDQPLLT